MLLGFNIAFVLGYVHHCQICNAFRTMFPYLSIPYCTEFIHTTGRNVQLVNENALSPTGPIRAPLSGHTNRGRGDKLQFPVQDPPKTSRDCTQSSRQPCRSTRTADAAPKCRHSDKSSGDWQTRACTHSPCR